MILYDCCLFIVVTVEQKKYSKDTAKRSGNQSIWEPMQQVWCTILINQQHTEATLDKQILFPVYYASSGAPERIEQLNSSPSGKKDLRERSQKERNMYRKEEQIRRKIKVRGRSQQKHAQTPQENKAFTLLQQ